MSKRFTETEKWKDPWFRKLPPLYKCFWIYLLDNCNNAGVWNIDWELAEMLIGQELPISEIATAFDDRINWLDAQYLQVKGFIKYQYGELSEASKPHRHVLALLEKYGLNKGYPKGIYTLKDKDKDKDKDRDKDSADYKIPDPKTEPARCLVLTYKTMLGVAHNDRLWDKKNFPRNITAATEILHYCKDLSTAESCLKQISENMDKADRTWTLETIAKHAPDWLKKNGRTDANASRIGLRMAIAKRQSEKPGQDSLVKISEGSVLDAVRAGKDPEHRIKKDDNEAPRGVHETDVD